MNTTDFAPIPPVLYGHEVDREYEFDLAAAHEAALAWLRETPDAFMFWPSSRPIPTGFTCPPIGARLGRRLGVRRR